MMRGPDGNHDVEFKTLFGRAVEARTPKVSFKIPARC